MNITQPLSTDVVKSQLVVKVFTTLALQFALVRVHESLYTKPNSSVSLIAHMIRKNNSKRTLPAMSRVYSLPARLWNSARTSASVGANSGSSFTFGSPCKQHATSI